MKLSKISEHIWCLPYESERDRPNLCYIHGKRWNMAIDAGHSAEHTQEFYSELTEAGLPLPNITVITHWHWDHTFGMHAVHGLCVASKKTNRHLIEFRERLAEEGDGFFLQMHESIRKEYEGGKPVIVVPADIVYSGEMSFDLGGVHVRIFEAEAPHTDDSTLIEVIEDKILFVGDSTCGTFPEWVRDEKLCDSLADVIRASAAETVVEGHWEPVEKEDTLKDMYE